MHLKLKGNTLEYHLLLSCTLSHFHFLKVLVADKMVVILVCVLVPFLLHL